MSSELAAALGDSHTEVRVAAATAFLTLLQPVAPQNSGFSPPLAIRSSGDGVLKSIFKAFFGIPLATTEPVPDNENVPPVDTDAAAADQMTDTLPATGPATEESTPVEGAEPEKLTPRDRWLAELYTGVHRAAWTSALVDPLRQMLVAESAEERLAAALGSCRWATMTRFDPRCSPRHARIRLCWPRPAMCSHGCRGEACEELFWELASTVRNDDELLELASDLSDQADVRLADVYFKLMEREGVSRELMQLAEFTLQRPYLSEDFLEPEGLSAHERERIVNDLEPRTHTGPVAKRILAIVLLRSVAADKAVAGARELMDDETVAPAQRLDAFQLVLATQTRSDRVKQAVSTLTDPDPSRRLVALKYLARGWFRARIPARHRTVRELRRR